MQQKPGEIEQNLINEMNDLIKSIQKVNPGITEEGICIALKYNDGYISQARSRKNASQKFIDTLKRYLATLQNANPNKETDEPTAMQLMKIIVETNESIRKDHRELISLHKQIVETNAKLADTNSELAKKIPSPTPTESVSEENQLTFQSNLGKILAAIARVGSGKRWHSQEEAAAALHKEFFGELVPKKEVGIQSGSHK